MGLQPSKPLQEVTKEELASLLEGLGPKFIPYADAIRENAVDGELLYTLGDVEFAETLADLDIVSRLHQRVLTKEWRAFPRISAEPQVPRDVILGESSNDDESSTTSKSFAKKLLAENPEWAIDYVPINISDGDRRKIFEAVSAYELTEGTEVCELEGFDRIADKALKECNALYAGVHMVDKTGHLSLSSRSHFNGDRESLSLERMHAPIAASLCHAAILGDDEDFITKEIGKGRSPFNASYRASKYLGCVMRSKSGSRVGIVCAYLDGDDAVDDHKKKALKELAVDAEKQLELRGILVERNRRLRCQLSESNLQNAVVLPAVGPLKEVTNFDLKTREKSPFPTRKEVLKIGKPQRTAMLPIFHNDDAADEEDRAHLPDDYFAAADAMGVDRTPVHKNDMLRVAAVESYNLKDISFDDPTGIALKRLTDLAASIFDCDYAEVTFLTHDKCYNMANHMSCTPEVKEVLSAFKPVLKSEPGGEPWLCSMDRGLAFCNYVAYTGHTFTLNDVFEDESFAWAKAANACKFYSSSPIVVRGQSVSALCIYDFRRAHPEFTEAHQIQQEKLADMAAQHVENWVLRQEMVDLEREHSLINAKQASKELPPDYLASAVFTDIQNSTSLWEADPAAMHDALILHNQILRQCIADNHGFEIKTEGDSFHIVFHDCIDAVAFALQAQVELHNAPWSVALLSLSDACDDEGNGWRGLRMRTSIHCGPVTFRNNGVSGRREYTGTTINVAKSLEKMTHGGQILATSDVWNVASYVSETKLNSPHVLDLGLHVLLTGTKRNEGLIEKSVVQLVPSELAFDYTADRTQRTLDANQVSERRKGRQFPLVVTARRVSASFHEAPYVGNIVTMMFLSTTGVEAVYDDPLILSAFAKQIGSLLGRFPSGYQCKDFMLAFPSLSEAVGFGLTLQGHLKDNLVAGANLASLVKIGVHHGPFTSMGPHQTTGRADYFGTVVNRAARVADVADRGEVVVGTVEGEKPMLASGLVAFFVGRSILKGVQEEMDIYVCRRERQLPRKSKPTLFL